MLSAGPSGGEKRTGVVDIRPRSVPERLSTSFPSWPMSASGWAGLLGALVGGDHGRARSSSSHFDGGALAPYSKSFSRRACHSADEIGTNDPVLKFSACEHLHPEK